MEREQVWGLLRSLRLEFSECTQVKSFFASVVKVGSRTDCSYLCITSPTLVSAVEDLSFSTNPEFFSLFHVKSKDR